MYNIVYCILVFRISVTLGQLYNLPSKYFQLGYYGGAPVTVDISSTTPFVDSFEFTPSEMAWTIDHHVGDYVTRSFQYANVQYDGLFPRYKERCFNQYLVCLQNMESAQQPYCAWHRVESDYPVYYTFASMCSMYLDMCRKGVPYWRPGGLGLCHYENYSWGNFGNYIRQT